MFIVFGFTFYFGIFGNPNFNINDFFMNMAGDIIWLAVSVVIIEGYIRARNKAYADKKEEDNKK